MRPDVQTGIRVPVCIIIRVQFRGEGNLAGVVDMHLSRDKEAGTYKMPTTGHSISGARNDAGKALGIQIHA
jgi:hypothetical protein